MLTLAVLGIGLGCVSAENLDDANSTMVSIDENSQLNEINDINFDYNNLQSTNGDILEVSDDGEDDLEAGDVSLSVIDGKSSYSKSDSVIVKMGTYSMASSSDAVSVFLNNKNIATTSYGTIAGAGFAVPLSSAQIGSNSIYCSFTASGIWSLTSDSVTVTVSDGGSDTPVGEDSASITIYDMAHPSQSVITSDGDYVSDIAYTITKSGDGFSDESLEIVINGQTLATATPTFSNRLGNLTFTEDNEWTLTLIYTAIVNGKTISATSNALTFITRNTSGGNSSTNGTGDNNGSSGEDPQPGEISVIIRDANHPNDAVISLNDEYNAVIEYYVTVPSGSLLTNDLIIKCNGQSITTVNPTDKTYTTIGGSVFINETGDYVFTAEYMYYVWGGDSNRIQSNSITYHVSISEEPRVSITVNNVFYPKKSTATVSSNVDGIYVVTVGNDTYEVSVSGGIGTVDFQLPEGDYTASVESKTNSSLANSTEFSVYPKAIVTPSMSVDNQIDGNRVTISITLPSDINEEKVTVTLGNQITKEADISNGQATVEFTDLENGDYSYTIIYPGNDDYGRRSYYGSFSIQTSTPVTNDTGNSSGSGNGSGSDTNQSGFEGSSIVATDLTRGQNSPYDFKATFYDKNGNPLANGDVNFIINGNDNIVKTDEYGVAKLVNKLDKGQYQIVIRNYATGEIVTRNLTIVGRITGNSNINVDYSFSATYKVRVFADNGNAVGAGERVVISINGKSTTAITDKNGYATYKVSGLLPKTYSITAVYKGVKVSNKVVVKQILKAKNAKFKKSKKVKKFKATLKTSKGKAIAGKKVTLKVKGKTYKAKTNKKGVATFKIKNLKKVGKFKATIKYLKTSIKKTIKVRR